MEKTFRYLLTGLIAVVALTQFVQVITRYIFEVPIMGLEESIVIPTLWLYMLGAVNASREDTQIRANVLEIFIKTERGHTILALGWRGDQFRDLALADLLGLGLLQIRPAGMERKPDPVYPDIFPRVLAVYRAGNGHRLYRAAHHQAKPSAEIPFLFGQ